MPAMNGLDFLRAVRESDPDVPFLLYTGMGSEETASEAIAHGVSDYLRKGTDGDQFDALADRVRRIVGDAA
jgi:DNA-binding NtrC family response regulator